MTGSLIFLVALLAVVVALNWRLLAAKFGGRVSACDWHRIEQRDREGRRAWFCAACGRAELTDGRNPPPDCGAKLGR